MRFGKECTCTLVFASLFLLASPATADVDSYREVVEDIEGLIDYYALDETLEDTADGDNGNNDGIPIDLRFPLETTSTKASSESTMAEALGRAGAKVAVLDLRPEAADAVAERIRSSGGQALGVASNVLERESLEEARRSIESELGPIDILINGAGGNHPKGTTSKEFLDPTDLEKAAADLTTFYDLEPVGIEPLFQPGSTQRIEFRANLIVHLGDMPLINIVEEMFGKANTGRYVNICTVSLKVLSQTQGNEIDNLFGPVTVT